MSRLVSGDAAAFEASDRAMRPQTLAEFVGQEACKANLKVFIDAARARGTPRVAGRLLRRVRDFATAEGSPTIDQAAAARGLARLEVDEAGLDALDRRYLRALIDNYGGGPAGADTLSYAIAEARDAVEDVIEPFLLQQGFIQRTPRGRVACARAYLHLGLPEPPTAAKVQPGLFEEE